jgi:hypothetical protein
LARTPSMHIQTERRVCICIKRTQNEHNHTEIHLWVTVACWEKFERRSQIVFTLKQTRLEADVFAFSWLYNQTRYRSHVEKDTRDSVDRLICLTKIYGSPGRFEHNR